MSRAAALLLTVIAAASCAKPAAAPPPPPPPKPIQVLTLAPSERRDTGEYLGTLLSRESVTVLAQVSGYVRKVIVRPGQTVAVGDPLVEVDARADAAALRSASAQAESAQAALALAKKNGARAESLFRDGLVSAQEVEQRRADIVAAQAAVRAATAQVAERQVEVGNNVVRAPVRGVLGDVDVRVGDFVTATTRLTSVADAGTLELTVAVPAARARRLAAGAPVELLDDDGAVLVATTAFFVSPEADPRTQLVEVKASFTNTAGLRPSELVRTRVVYASTQALQIPLLAVVRQSGQAFVYRVVEQGGATSVERHPVQLGPVGERGVVVTAGLAAGDRIAVSAIQALRDGAAVTIAPPPPAAAQAP